MAGDEPRLRVLTPPGAGGVAVLAVEGADRWTWLAERLRGREGLPLTAARLAGRGPVLTGLVIGGRSVDQVLCVDRPARDRTELHLHGSPAVLALLEQSFGSAAPVPPHSSAERLLREARSDAQLALALEQLPFGGIDAWLAALSGRPAAERRAALAAACARSRVAVAMVESLRLVLVGPQNAGKSTLFNRLLLAERALTAPCAGTTRDAVCEPVVLGGYPYELVDTAGIGPVVDEDDARAQQRGGDSRAAALCILVGDGSRPFAVLEALAVPGPVLVVRNKADLASDPSWAARAPAALALACREPALAPAVRRMVGEHLRAARGLAPPPQRGVGGFAALDREEFSRLEASRSAR